MQENVATYHMLFLICLIVGIVFFLLAIVLFIAFRIPRVINELSGRAAKKEIANMKATNAQSGNIEMKRPGNAGAKSDKSGIHLPQYEYERTEALSGENETTTEKLVMKQSNTKETIKKSEDFLQTSVLKSGLFSITKDDLFVHTDETI